MKKISFKGLVVFFWEKKFYKKVNIEKKKEYPALFG